jgi:hypothetical protein
MNAPELKSSGFTKAELEQKIARCISDLPRYAAARDFESYMLASYCLDGYRIELNKIIDKEQQEQQSPSTKENTP